MILNDFRCPEHGDFESSHPICPALGCESEGVVKVFLKAPGRLSASTRRFDAGIRDSAERMGISNFRSAKPGEAAYGGKAGSGVLWGNECQKITKGMGFAQLAASAGQEFKRPDGRTEYGNAYKMANGETKVVPHGMRQAATELGVTKRPLPRAERIIDPRDVPR